MNRRAKSGMPAILFALLLCAAVCGRAQHGRPAQRQLMQKEQEWLDAVRRGALEVLAGALADDFIGTVGMGTVDKGQLLAAIKDLNLTGRLIAIEHNRLRVYGDTAVSTGRASVAGAAEGRVVIERGPATPPATVNLNEAARREAAAPTKPNRRKAVPAPLPVPSDRPVPGLGDKPGPDGQYLYTAVYVRRQTGWQLVALHLTRFSE